MRMRSTRLCAGTFLLAAMVVAEPAAARQIGISQRNFNEQTLRESGAPVYPVYEGWYRADDGTRRLCFGYLNANTAQVIEIPHGDRNRVEPAAFDGVQPTHFRPVPARSYRRDYCVFTVVWPESFGPDDRIVWTIDSHDEPLSAPGHVMAAYELDDRSSPGRGDVAPVITFGSGNPVARGRTGALWDGLEARVGEPLELSMHVEHPSPGSWLIWAKHDGPGAVTFAEPELRVGQEDGRGTTTATFDTPGEYLLRVQAVNSLGSFDFYCCWTNGYLRITVQP